MTSTDTDTEQPVEMSGAHALWLLTRRFVIGSLAIVGAFTIGLVLIIGAAALFDDDDDYYTEPYWEEPLPIPERVEPQPSFSNQAASIEYRLDSRDDSIDVRADGACGDDVEYSIVETDREIQVLAEVDSRSFACSNSDWVRLHLDDEVGDRIVVNAAAGYTARPVIR